MDFFSFFVTKSKLHFSHLNSNIKRLHNRKLFGLFGSEIFFGLTFLADVTCRGTSLGMEDSTVSGGGILASSWYSPYITFAPFQGRLNNLKGSWCANKPEKDPNPYLQVREQTRFRRAGDIFCALWLARESLLLSLIIMINKTLRSMTCRR